MDHRIAFTHYTMAKTTPIGQSWAENAYQCLHLARLGYIMVEFADLTTAKQSVWIFHRLMHLQLSATSLSK